jgi:hypothetical protein
VARDHAPDSPLRGTCYGYSIHSELDFRYLREGTGEPLEVVGMALPDDDPGELLRAWEPPDFPVHVRLYRSEGAFRLWNEEAGWFGIEPQVPRLIVPPEGDPMRREERLWGLPVMLCFLARGDLAVHASSVEVDGRALVLAAPRRFGKTTLASAFAAEGFRVLAEDLTCIRLGPDPSVIPGPAMLRIRRDVADRVPVEEAQELGRDEDRVHLALESARGTCDPVPMGGIALLLEDEADPRMERATLTDAIRDLWFLSFKFPEDEDRARCLDSLTRLASAAPAWHLTRRLEVQALKPTVECLVEALGSEG